MINMHVFLKINYSLLNNNDPDKNIHIYRKLFNHHYKFKHFFPGNSITLFVRISCTGTVNSSRMFKLDSDSSLLKKNGQENISNIS